MWTAAAMGREANCSYNQCFAFDAPGAVAGRVSACRARSGRCPPRGLARRLRARRRQPDDAAPFSVELPFTTWSDLDLRRARARTRALLEQECETPFDLAEGPLVRAFVVREAATRIVSSSPCTTSCATGGRRRCCSPTSGRSTWQIASGSPRSSAPRRRIETTSPSRRARGTSPPPPRTRTSGPRVSPTERRFSTCLSRARPAVKTYRSGRENLPIDAELYAALKRTGHGREPRSSPPSLAAYEVLLSRLSGQSDFVVGIPFAGQPRLENDARRPLREHRAAARDRRPGRPFHRPPPLRRARSRRCAGPLALTFGSLVRRLQHRPRPEPHAPRRDDVQHRQGRGAVRLRRRDIASVARRGRTRTSSSR